MIKSEEDEEIIRVLICTRNVNGQAIATQKQNMVLDRERIISKHIINTKKIPNVGYSHVVRPSLGETRNKITKQDIANGKQCTLG